MRFSGSRVQMELITFSINQCHSITLPWIDYNYYPPSYLWHFLLQTSIFVYNFCSKVYFCEKKIAVILFCGNPFLRIAKKTAKIAKVRTRKNLVPHGMLSHARTFDLKVSLSIQKSFLRNCAYQTFKQP